MSDRERVLAEAGSAAPPRANGELVFEAPWESRIFGLTLALFEDGRFEWQEFQSHLIEAIARHETELGLDASIAVCPPTDPARAMDALNNGFFAYERYFFKRWHGSLQRKLQCFPELDYDEELATAKSLDDLNRIFIPQHTIYSNVDDYFAAYALVGGRLSSMAVPAYLIAAEDDPIVPVDDLNRIDPVETLQIETYRHGGHCGFIENLAAHSWVEGRMLRILQGHM